MQVHLFALCMGISLFRVIKLLFIFFFFLLLLLLLLLELVVVVDLTYNFVVYLLIRPMEYIYKF